MSLIENMAEIISLTERLQEMIDDSRAERMRKPFMPVANQEKNSDVS